MIGETNINGGGGFNGGKALIKIQAQTGSIIIVSKDSSQIVVKKSMVLNDNWSCWFFETNNFGTWTITASLGNEIASDTIIIDGNKQYDLTLDFSLPNSYQKVAYIESSGTQHIITDTTPQDITKFTTVFKLKDSSLTSMYGTYDKNIAGDLYVGRYTSSNSQVRVSYAGIAVDIGNVNTTITYNIEADFINNTLIFNNTLYNFSGTLTEPNSMKIGVFCRNSLDGFPGSGKIKAQLYSLSFYNGNDLIEQFTPCYRISDSIAGLWGRYAKKLYTNDGTGSFIVGPNV